MRELIESLENITENSESVRRYVVRIWKGSRFMNHTISVSDDQIGPNETYEDILHDQMKHLKNSENANRVEFVEEIA